jgi:hypothetical protein
MLDSHNLINILQHAAHPQRSACISKFEKQYMLDGTLPPPDAKCEADIPNPFLNPLASLGNSTQTLIQGLA